MGFLSKLLGKKGIDDEPVDEQQAQAEQNPVVAQHMLAEMDRFENGQGEFGSISNPIPVNGPGGETVYLNRLRTSDGVPFLYHRTGSLDVEGFPTLDRFELMSIDGAAWRVLYMSMYHPRRSQEVPPGLARTPWPSDRIKQIFLKTPFGVMTKVDDFPAGLPDMFLSWGEGKLPPPILNGSHVAISRIVEALPPQTQRPAALDDL